MRIHINECKPDAYERGEGMTPADVAAQMMREAGVTTAQLVGFSGDELADICEKADQPVHRTVSGE